MRLVRVRAEGRTHFCLVDEEGTITTLNNRPGDPEDFLDLLRAPSGGSVVERARALAEEGHQLSWSMEELDVAPGPDRPHLLMPYTPPEVWGAAFTYKKPETNDQRFAAERKAVRPVIFFKATADRCVGPNDAVGSRGDSNAIIPEPELGLVLSSEGDVLGYTIGNDMTARDLADENPLYVCYSKTYSRCMSLGPAIVPSEALRDPKNLEVRGRVTRGTEVLWDAVGNTSNMYRTFADLIGYLIAHNKVPYGTLLATGTAVSPPRDMHLIAGDLVELEIEGIGRLANPVVQV